MSLSTLSCNMKIWSIHSILMAHILAQLKLLYTVMPKLNFEKIMESSLLSQSGSHIIQ